MAIEILLLLVAILVCAIVLAVASRREARLEAVVRILGRPSGTDPVLAAEEAVLERVTVASRLQYAVAEAPQLAAVLVTGVARIDADLQVTWANQHIHELFGRPPGTIEGRTLIGAFADHRVEEAVRLALAAGGAEAADAYSIEIALREAPHRVIALRVAPVARGGAWLVADDRTQLRRLEGIRAEFLDNLSHELRTPLTNIRLLTESLGRTLDADSAPARIRDAVRRIDVESGHLVQMVTEVLDLARIEEGTTRLVLSDVDLGALARSCAERLATFAERQKVTLRVDVPAGLPRLRGDENRLGQLLLNLLHNAVKFSRAGGDVVVRADQRGPEVVLSVQDHGVGIPRGDRERVFERFYKVDRARHRGAGGTGLGLTIARHIAESHGGRITVESEDGQGSTFSVALPIHGAAGQDEPAPGPRDASESEGTGQP
jgi:two-component system, OmpR family, phosphate regulon sensor histidine kinase PhoR